MSFYFYVVTVTKLILFVITISLRANLLTHEFLFHTIFPQAEARLAAKRQARAEAREIRMRELDRQQKELEQNADRVYDMQQSEVLSTPRSRLAVNNHSSALRGNSVSSRRSSEDSLEEEGRSLRDLRQELKVTTFILRHPRNISLTVNHCRMSKNVLGKR